MAPELLPHHLDHLNICICISFICLLLWAISMYLIIVCLFSRWVEAFPCWKAVATTIAKKLLENVFSLQGIPNLIYFLNFIYLFFAALGLRCCVRAFSSCSKRGYSLLQCAGFSCGAWALGVRASVVVARRLSSCGSRALEHRFSSCGTRA